MDRRSRRRGLMWWRWFGRRIGSRLSGICSMHLKRHSRNLRFAICDLQFELMIDSHCHLTYEPLAKQLGDVLARAEAAGVQRMITIGTDLADAQRAIELCRGHANIHCTIGIHPHHSAQAQDEDVAWLRSLQQSPAVVALGEMGLDYHHDFAPR